MVPSFSKTKTFHFYFSGSLLLSQSSYSFTTFSTTKILFTWFLIGPVMEYRSSQQCKMVSKSPALQFQSGPAAVSVGRLGWLLNRHSLLKTSKWVCPIL